ncbi:adenine phosphoribosyltransferase [Syntrophotalea acetylenica]|uniref:adenine phosphoribosyltransferase n=1 Tax=Syntrophotalea acetylenica TaxID=29542 RepID=UPI002A369DD9|nr:adenine phosphoribosyltransferase [Syntrophotalea acetylenica]MDY0262503.1 adenine phosphoribosyltransferase [Syntrophotalea acetylenica]
MTERNLDVEDLRNAIRDIPDFPKKGIVYKDITTLLSDAKSYHRMVDLIAHRYIGQKIDQIVGIEARGFILGAALAYKLGTGITLVRKPGKLPYKTIQKTYQLEYGTDSLEIHSDAFKVGDRVIVADDLLATGGTVAAVIEMVEDCGAQIVECAFLAELEFLKGREKLQSHKVFSLLKF